VDIVLVTAGVACLIAAVAGVAIKALNVEIGRIASRPRQVLLGLLGVAFLAGGIVMRDGNDTSEKSETTTEVATTTPEPFFPDDFATPGTRRWEDDADTEGTGGRYTGGTYHIVAEREMGRRGVLVSARTAPPEDVRLAVDAHRVRESASLGYGYGFCRRAPDGWDTLYHFTIFAQQAVIAKSVGGQPENLATDPGITANDADKTLEAVCRTVQGGRAVSLEFRVGDIIIPTTDEDSPIRRSGSFGMHVALLPEHGIIGDTLEVEFDNFKAFMLE
jgi:hypothetical protein